MRTHLNSNHHNGNLLLPFQTKPVLQFLSFSSFLRSCLAMEEGSRNMSNNSSPDGAPMGRSNQLLDLCTQERFKVYPPPKLLLY